MKDLAKLARYLDNALVNQKEVSRLTVDHPDLTLTEAYQIQDFGIQRRVERGEKPIGFKMGLTSKAKMEQMGLHSPIYGVLTDRMKIENNSVESLAKWVHGKIEPEIAFLISKDLRGPVTEDDVLAACSGVAPALEILDSRFEGFKYFSLPDVVADNSSSSAFVVGPRWIPIKSLNLANLKIELIVDDQVVAKAISSDVYGSPLKSVVELCNLLRSRDQYLKKGSIVLSGAATQAVELKAGQKVSARVETLGEVTVAMEKKESGGCPIMKPKAYGAGDLNYNDYLKVPEILSAQVLQSKPPHHDELLFIIIHQTYELWFKLILHELETVRTFLTQSEPLQAHHFMKRVVKIMSLLVDQIHVLETMTPADFLKFRNRLMPASGFQSGQFREIEFIAGAKEPAYLRFFDSTPEIKKTLEKRLAEPDLFSAYLEMLVSLKLATKESLKTTEGQVKAIVPLYQNSSQHLPVYLLTEALVEFDENLALWREHHVRVVERIIGSKTGTGGSSGVEYLKTTTAKKCFPVLWDVRNYIT